MRRYDRGVEKTVHIAEVTCLWYGSSHARTVRVIFVRNAWGKLEIALITTDLDASAADLVQRYAARWGIEVTFEEARQHLGVGQAENRTRRAVERTIPFGLYVYTITVTWYALHGYHPADVAEHRARSPWYSSKTAPSFHDMLVKLHRTIIAARLIPNHADQPTDHEITAVHLAWTAAVA